MRVNINLDSSHNFVFCGLFFADICNSFGAKSDIYFIHPLDSLFFHQKNIKS